MEPNKDYNEWNSKQGEIDENVIALAQNLELIKEEYDKLPEELKKEVFHPLPRVIQLLTSLDPEHEQRELEFQTEMMDAALDTIVEGFYKGFNRSITNFSSILTCMAQIQTRLETLKSELKGVQTSVIGRNSDLGYLWSQSVQYKETLRILDKLNDVCEIPGKIDEYVAAKEYYIASKLLVHGVTMLHSDELINVGALMDLRLELVERKNLFHEVLIEEIHNFLYSRGTFQSLSISTGDEWDGTTTSTSTNIGALNMNLSGSVRAKTISPFHTNRGSGSGSGSGGVSTTTGHGHGHGHTRQSSGGGSGGSGTLSRTMGKRVQHGSVSIQAGRDVRALMPLFHSGGNDESEYPSASEMTPRQYIRSLVDACKCLDRIPSLLKAVESRLPAELNNVIVEACSSVFNSEADALKILHARNKNISIDRSRSMSGKASGSGPASNRASVSLSEAKDVVLMSKEIVQKGSAMLLSVFSGVFHRFLDVLRNHMFLINTVDSRNQNKGQGQGGAAHGQNQTFLSIDEVWNAMQRQLQLLLWVYLDMKQSDPVELIDSSLGLPLADGIEVSASSQSRLFSFADSSQDTNQMSGAESLNLNVFGVAGDVSGTASVALSGPPPSRYYVVALYRPLMVFTDQANTLIRPLQAGDLSILGGLRSYLDSYIDKVFIPVVRSDYQMRVNGIVQAPSAFLPKPSTEQAYLRVEDRRPSLTCALDMSVLLSDLRAYAASMAMYKNDIVSIAETCLFTFIDAAKKTFSDLAGRTDAARILLSPDAIHVLQMDPVWRSQILVHDQSASNAFETTSFSSLPSVSSSRYDVDRDAEYDDDAAWTAERALEDELYSTPPKRLIGPKLLAHVAALHDSLDWIASVVSCVATGDPTDAPELRRAPSTTRGATIGISTMQMSIPVPIPPSLPSSTEKQKHSRSHSGSSNVNFFGSVKDGSTPSSLGHLLPQERIVQFALGGNLESLAARLRKQGEECLFLIRLELRALCFMHLSKIDSVVYTLEDEAAEPDYFITELNRDLDEAYEAAAIHLCSSSKRLYIVHSLARLVSNMLVEKVSMIKRMNRNGALKMIRNISALQQNMAQLSSGNGNDHHFEHVRRFYELVMLPQEQLLNHASENAASSHRFSLDQYLAIVRISRGHIDAKTAQQLELLFSK